MTWWSHTGSREWVQYDFDVPREVSAVDVYWFDDTGRGGCRIPAGWRILVRQGDRWKPLQEDTNLPAAKDRFDTVEFDAVEAAAIRLENAIF